MEDVDWHVKRQLLQLCALILLTLFAHNLYAATQGSLGRGSSGTIGISLYIPEHTRLVAHANNNESSTICLNVIDSRTTSLGDFYRVTNTNYESVDIIEDQIKIIHLSNQNRADSNITSSCLDYQALSHQHENIQTNNPMLFILVAE